MKVSEQKQRERAANRAAKLDASLNAQPRPGIKHEIRLLQPETVELPGTILSPVEWRNPQELKHNPLNPYPPLPDVEFSELVSDIRANGVLISLITRMDGRTLICGHNRSRAAVEAGIKQVPVQRVLEPDPLTPEAEAAIMKSENDYRRGGKWSLDLKRDFIAKNFADEISSDRRGGARGNQFTGGKRNTEREEPLPERISRASRGKIGAAEAKVHLAELRKQRTGKTRGIQVKAPSQTKGNGAALATEIRKIDRSLIKLQSRIEQLTQERKARIRMLLKIGPLSQWKLKK